MTPDQLIERLTILRDQATSEEMEFELDQLITAIQHEELIETRPEYNDN